MQYPLDLAIREHLAAYLAGEISLHEFEDWFFPKTWDVDKVESASLTELVYKIKLDWAEFSHGDWTEEELRDKFRSLVEHFTVGGSPIIVSYGTSSVNFQSFFSITSSGLSVDIRSARACA